MPMPLTDPPLPAPAPAACSPAPVGVLLINLGTPDAPDAPAIRRYLREFLSDRRVVDLPAWLWQPVLRGVILPFRTRKLVAKYAQVWRKDGSPLLVWSQAQAHAVHAALVAQHGSHAIRLALCMRYGRPSIAQALQTLQGCGRILLVPMYPQYARSTTATAEEAVRAALARLPAPPTLRVIQDFHQTPAYIDALAGQLTRHWAQHGRAEKTLLSFHSLPVKVIRQGDPYYDQCLQTAACLRQRLGLDEIRLSVSFQSRFGRQQWLQPCTMETLKSWGQQGVKTVEVLCPGFLADCLETLEEIQIRGRDAFIQSGGQALHYLPCLNDDALWARGFAELITLHLQGWLDNVDDR